MAFQLGGIESHRGVEHDGSQVFGEEALLSVVAHILSLFAFEFIGMGDHVFHAAVFPDEE